MTALVTGASGGLGTAIALALAEDGHDIAVHGRDANRTRSAAEAVEATGRRAHVLTADLATDLAGGGAAELDALADRLLTTAEDALGPLDVVVLNAFPQDVVAWPDLDTAAWDAMYAGGLRPSAALLHSAGRHFAAAVAGGHAERSEGTGGVIVVIGSIEGLRPAPDHAAYAVAKAALHQLVAAGAQELGPQGTRVVGIAPGLIAREGLTTDWPEGVRRWEASVPLGRVVEAAEVARVVAFVASPDASGLTGTTIPVDAGWSASPGW